MVLELKIIKQKLEAKLEITDFTEELKFIQKD